MSQQASFLDELPTALASPETQANDDQFAIRLPLDIRPTPPKTPWEQDHEGKIMHTCFLNLRVSIGRILNPCFQDQRKGKQFILDQPSRGFWEGPASVCLLMFHLGNVFPDMILWGESPMREFPKSLLNMFLVAERPISTDLGNCGISNDTLAFLALRAIINQDMDAATTLGFAAFQFLQEGFQDLFLECGAAGLLYILRLVIYWFHDQKQREILSGITTAIAQRMILMFRDGDQHRVYVNETNTTLFGSLGAWTQIAITCPELCTPELVDWAVTACDMQDMYNWSETPRYLREKRWLPPGARRPALPLSGVPGTLACINHFRQHCPVEQIFWMKYAVSSRWQHLQTHLPNPVSPGIVSSIVGQAMCAPRRDFMMDFLRAAAEHENCNFFGSNRGDRLWSLWYGEIGLAWAFMTIACHGHTPAILGFNENWVDGTWDQQFRWNTHLQKGEAHIPLATEFSFHGTSQDDKK